MNESPKVTQVGKDRAEIHIQVVSFQRPRRSPPTYPLIIRWGKHSFQPIFQKRKLTDIQRISDCPTVSKLVCNRTRICTHVIWSTLGYLIYNLATLRTLDVAIPISQMSKLSMTVRVICQKTAWLLSVRAGIQTPSTWLFESEHERKRGGTRLISGSFAWGLHSVYSTLSLQAQVPI